MAGIPVTLQVVTKYLTEATKGRKVVFGHGLRVKTIRAAEAQDSWSFCSPEAERDEYWYSSHFFYSTHDMVPPLTLTWPLTPSCMTGTLVTFIV